MVIIELNHTEQLIATHVGALRRWHSRERGSQDQIIGSDPAALDREGAMAEMAFAKYLNIYWDFGVGTYKKPDVGSYQVRMAVANLDNWDKSRTSLILRANDAESQKYVLAVGRRGKYALPGWILGLAGKKPEHLRSGQHPAWFVPIGALEPIEGLNDKTN